MKLRIGLVTVLILGFSFTGWEAQRVSYFDHSPYWGVQVSADDEVVAAPVDSSVEVAKLRQQVQELVQQQRWLYNQLFNAQVTLEEKSHLEFGLINRMGPMANMYLKDFTKTQDALVAAATYEANLPAESPLRPIMSELRMALTQTDRTKAEFLERLNKHHVEHPIIIEYTEPVYVPPPVSDDPYQSYEGTWIPAQPVWYRTWNISQEDGWLLFAGHRIMADIDTVQTRMAKNVLTIVQRYQASESSEVKVPGRFMFLQNKSKERVRIGDPLYRCRAGLYWCSRIGSIVEINTTPRQTLHPTSGKVIDGYVVEVELSDQQAKIIHVNRP